MKRFNMKSISVVICVAVVATFGTTLPSFASYRAYKHRRPLSYRTKPNNLTPWPPVGTRVRCVGETVCAGYTGKLVASSDCFHWVELDPPADAVKSSDPNIDSFNRAKRTWPIERDQIEVIGDE